MKIDSSIFVSLFAVKLIFFDLPLFLLKLVQDFDHLRPIDFTKTMLSTVDVPTIFRSAPQVIVVIRVSAIGLGLSRFRGNKSACLFSAST